jgi:hypothetical protein
LSSPLIGYNIRKYSRKDAEYHIYDQTETVKKAAREKKKNKKKIKKIERKEKKIHEHREQIRKSPGQTGRQTQN